MSNYIDRDLKRLLEEIKNSKEICKFNKDKIMAEGSGKLWAGLGAGHLGEAAFHELLHLPAEAAVALELVHELLHLLELGY